MLGKLRSIILLVFVLAPVIAQQCQNCTCGQTCNNMCGTVCLDGMTCMNGQQPIQCVGGWEPYCPTTPIIIDTKNQGFHLTNTANGVKFTFAGNLIQTSWTDPNFANGWLALDRNGNGIMDNAGELFGDLTPQPPGASPNGYKALAVYDDPKNGGNGNGRIDPGDAIWPKLLVWIDVNHNGISEPSELFTLSRVGISSISLNCTAGKKTDEYGNVFEFSANIEDKYGNQVPLCYDVQIMTNCQEKN